MLTPQNILAALVPILLVSCARVEDSSLYPRYQASSAQPPPAKRAVAANPDKNVFFGDLHIHTSYSNDAYTMGVRALPDDAFTYAQGGSIEHAAGYPIRLQRPLDFAAVTDHAEQLGILRAMQPDLPLSRRSLRDVLINGSRFAITKTWLQTVNGMDQDDIEYDANAESIMRNAWQKTIDAAQQHYLPGVFTTFIGYEWSATPNGDNLHRNIIYRGQRVPGLPYSSLQSNKPEDLWRELAKQHKRGMQALAIPHNSNLSNGRMWEQLNAAGKPLTAKQAALRERFEPISEIMQVKGTAETHPLLSPQDEFAHFENYQLVAEKESDSAILKGSYLRAALRTGLEFAHNGAVNPNKFGVIGSSGGHNASSPVEEDNYHGTLPMLDGSAALRMNTATLLPDSKTHAGMGSAAGLAAIWAEQNTRASLFDALRRKETYATSGPRIRLRFFGGWRYSAALLSQAGSIQQAYASGVPMGGELPARGSAAAPTFALWAEKDPQGANLDRVQIIKGWVDDSGQSHEKIYDVAASGERTPDLKTGKLPTVGNIVYVRNATYANAIGAGRLASVWRDPDFDPTVAAFYYARVIEIPTPRWTTFDATMLGLPAPSPSTLQERAVSSAIWYSPSR